MLDYKGTGMSVMEMEPPFSRLIRRSLTRRRQILRELMNIPDNYKVLFCRRCFPAICHDSNEPDEKNKKADYIITGQWAKKAYQEAKAVW